MTDNEIIKALECCAQPIPICKECPCYDSNVPYPCADQLKWATLNLIDSQQTEIERLNSLVDDHFWDFCSIAGCEGASNDCWKTCPDSRYNKIKSEAIKEFAEKLKEKVHIFESGFEANEDRIVKIVTLKDIDNLLKEMVGDTE